MNFMVNATWGQPDGTLEKTSDIIETTDAICAVLEASERWKNLHDSISAEISITVRKEPKLK